MIALLDAAGARSLDRYTSEHTGIPSLCLMERAALAAADEICRMAGKDPLIRRNGIFVLAGTGNNGADGIAAARILKQRGFRCHAAALGDPAHASVQWQMQVKIFAAVGGVLTPAEGDLNAAIPSGFALYVDALFGTGLSRPLTGAAARAAERLNAAAAETEGAKILAVDIASGISASDGSVQGTAVRADVTVTFGPPKIGQFLYPGALYSGRVVPAEIGLDLDGWMRAPDSEKEDGARALELRDAAAMLPRRRPDGNKGTFGTVLVIAGAAGMAGAACLASAAALRGGAGLVKTVTSEKNRLVLQTLAPEAVMAGTLEERAGLERLIPAVKAVVIGPGLSRNADARAALGLVVSLHGEIPVVFDADALNLLAGEPELPVLGPQCVLTPHPGELARLLHTDTAEVKRRGIRACARELAAQTGAAVAAKDARTWTIVPGGAEYLNLTGNDGCGTGGSGDVLAGLTGGILAGGSAPQQAVPAAVWFHGLAGDLAARDRGKRGMTSRDICDHIPEALRTGDECRPDGREMDDEF